MMMVSHSRASISQWCDVCGVTGELVGEGASNEEKSEASQGAIHERDENEEAEMVAASSTAISKGAALPTTSEVPVANESAIKSTEPVVDLSQWRSDKCSSGYRGVNWHKVRGKFYAWFGGRKQYLGAYDTAEEAAMVVARTANSKAASLPEEEGSICDSESDDADHPAQNEEQHKAPVNDSPVKPSVSVVTKLSVPDPVVDLSQWRSDKCSSGYKGVTWHKVRGKFGASFKRQYLGAYDTAEEAAMVVARATISKAASLPTSSEVSTMVEIQIAQTPEHNTVTPNAEVEVVEAVAEDEEWQHNGHPWINQRVLRLFEDQKVSGVVTSWIPASTADLTAVDPALFHVVHDDGECA